MLLIVLLYTLCRSTTSYHANHHKIKQNLVVTIYYIGTVRTHTTSTKNTTYLKAECPRCFATRSSTSTSLPCSCNRSVFASTSRNIRLKCSLSTRSKWQLFSFSTIVAALGVNIVKLGYSLMKQNYIQIAASWQELSYKRKIDFLRGSKKLLEMDTIFSRNL